MGYKFLTEQQVDEFMKVGFTKLKGAFSKERAAEYTDDVWTRLGYDPDDDSTWVVERTNMPGHRSMPASEFSPAAWGAICELLGGQDRVRLDDESGQWKDSLIVNLGVKDRSWLEPRQIPLWHVDGDFFMHFLDSPEQALLVIPIFTDIKPRGGGTMISPDSIPIVAKFLAQHPEGVHPKGFGFQNILDQCENFVELTGEIGDVILMHPFMLHAASRNALRTLRVITNPPVAVNEPFQFNRPDPADFSLVERKTLNALGTDRFDFKATGPRDRVVPERVKMQEEMKKKELERIAALAASKNTPSAPTQNLVDTAS